MSFTELWNAFREVNDRRRWKPATLKPSDKEGWRILRRGLEEAMKPAPPPAAPDPTVDSRDYLRVPTALTAQYRVNGKWITSKLTSLGEGGCFLATSECLEPGCPLLLDITSEHGLLTSVRGQVVWNRAPGQGIHENQTGMAVRFLQLEMTQRIVLYSIIDRILYRFSIAEGIPDSSR